MLNTMPLVRQRTVRPITTKRTFGPIRLHLDDIAETHRIVCEFVAAETAERQAQLEHFGEGLEGELADLADELRTQMSQSYDVKIRVGDAIADEVDDLKQASTKELQSIMIRSYDPRVWVFLYRTMAHIEVDGNTDRHIALVEDVAHALRRRRTVVPLDPKALLAYGLTVASAVMAYLISAAPWRSLLVAVTGVALGWTLALILLPLRFGRSYVVPRWRREVEGLSQQSRRDLLVAAIGALFGGALAGVVTAMFTNSAGGS